MRPATKNHTLGFTLIELLVVTVILGLLAIVGLGAYLQGQVKARDARRKNDLKSVATALEAFYNDMDRYPLASDGQIVVAGCGIDNICAWGSEMKDTAGTSYMVQLPDDPNTDWDYCYATTDGGASYLILTRIENDQDSVIPKLVDGTNTHYDTSGLNCVEVVNHPYNYVVNSSNAAVPDVVVPTITP